MWVIDLHPRAAGASSSLGEGGSYPIGQTPPHPPPAPTLLSFQLSLRQWPSLRARNAAERGLLPNPSLMQERRAPACSQRQIKAKRGINNSSPLRAGKRKQEPALGSKAEPETITCSKGSRVPSVGAVPTMVMGRPRPRPGFWSLDSFGSALAASLPVPSLPFLSQLVFIPGQAPARRRLLFVPAAGVNAQGH